MIAPVPASIDEVLEDRFLVVAPIGRDAALTCALLERAGIHAHACRDLTQLCFEIGRGAAGAAIAQEVLRLDHAACLTALLEQQAPWSDLPIILFTRENTDTVALPHSAELLRALGNVTLLDRPLRPITMVSAARAGLRARRRQYQARDELERREKAVLQRDRFLAMLGHELRNPLGSIVLAADTLASDEPEHIRRIDIIRRQGKNLSRIVDDLLDVARVTTGKIALRRERVELNDLCARTLGSLEGVAASNGITMTLRRNATPVATLGDVVRLEQVVANLVTNGVKYTPSGGEVVVSVSAHDGKAVVRVQDNGLGIAPDVLPNVFDLFAQGERTLDRAQGGLGIGLTVVRALVDLHGGTIEASSAGLGRGSEFVLSLPIENGAPVISVDVPVPAGADPARHRVLLIEDNEDARELMEMVLDSYGHEVRTAADGVEGLNLALSMKPDVALIDLGLPHLNGFDVARRVRAELGTDMILIALSGYGQAEDRRQAFDAGFDLHYIKPVDSTRLRKLLDIGPAELRRKKHEGSLTS